MVSRYSRKTLCSGTPRISGTRSAQPVRPSAIRSAPYCGQYIPHSRPLDGSTVRPSLFLRNFRCFGVKPLRESSLLFAEQTSIQRVDAVTGVITLMAGVGGEFLN